MATQNQTPQRDAGWTMIGWIMAYWIYTVGFGAIFAYTKIQSKRLANRVIDVGFVKLYIDYMYDVKWIIAPNPAV